MEDIEAAVSLVTAEDIACNIAQGMSHVQSRSRRIRKHIQHIVFWTRGILNGPVGLVFHPPGLPFGFYFSEIIVSVHIE